MESLRQNHWRQSENYSIGLCVHLPTRLLMKSVPQGFYIEDSEYDIFNSKPLVVRDDMPALREVSARQVTNHDGVIGMGCGIFTCENGMVKISERTGHPGCLQVDIVANSVDNFNAAVQALMNGELKPVGSAQTVFEAMAQKIKELNCKLEASQLSCEGFRARAETATSRLFKLENFVFYAADCLSCRGEMPLAFDSMTERLIYLIAEIKNKTFKQRLWELFSYPHSPVEENKGNPEDDCVS